MISKRRSSYFPGSTLKIFIVLILLTTGGTGLFGADQFSIGTVYHNLTMINDADDTFRIQSPGLNVSFATDRSLDLLFSFNALIPLWLSENGSDSISYDYYTFPAAFDLYVGPYWVFTLGDDVSFEPSVGLQTGFTSLTGTGYVTVSYLPIGIGADMRMKVDISENHSLGFLVSGSWEIADLLHFKTHKTGYTFAAGITFSTRYSAMSREKGKTL